MAKIDRAAERERLDRIFDEIAGKMPEEPRKTQKEIDEENRRARIDRLSSQEPAEFIASVDDRILTAPWGTTATANAGVSPSDISPRSDGLLFESYRRWGAGAKINQA